MRIDELDAFFCMYELHLGCDSPALSWPDEECVALSVRRSRTCPPQAELTYARIQSTPERKPEDPPANQELSSEQLLAAARAASWPHWNSRGPGLLSTLPNVP